MRYIIVFLRFALLMFMVVFASTIHAIDFGYTVFSTWRQSDNLVQGNTPINGSALSNGFTFSLNNDTTSIWALDMTGSWSRENFSVDDLVPQNRKTLEASITYDDDNSNFGLLIMDNLSEVPKDRFATQDVNNITSLNVTTVRPSYFYDLSSTETIVARVFYVNSTRDADTNATLGSESFDSTNIGQALSFERKINATQTISLVGDNIDTTFGADSSLTTDFTQNNLFLRWVAVGRFNQIQLEAGKVRVKEKGGTSSDFSISNLLFTRQINQNQDMVINIRNGIFFALSGNAINNSVNVDDSGGAFAGAKRSETKNISYTLSGSSVSTDIAYFDNRYKGISTPSDERRRGFSLVTSYSLANFLNTSLPSNLSLTARLSDNKIRVNSGDFLKNNSQLIQLKYTHYTTRALSFSLALTTRKAERANLLSGSANGDSNSISVGFNYAPNRQFSNN